MVAYFTPQSPDFLWDLRMNNNKTWFTEHKNRFETHLNQPMKALAGTVFEHLSTTYPKKQFEYKVTRIYRDARRVRGGEPYKENLWFFIEKRGEDFSTTPGFWFEISPEGWTYGMGYYHAKASTMAKFRARLDSQPEVFRQLMQEHVANSQFVLQGESYKRPKPAPAGLEDWYNRKNFALSCEAQGHGAMYGEGLKKILIDGFTALMPVYTYFASLENEEIL